MGEVWLAEAAWLSGQKTRLADQWEYFGDRKRLFHEKNAFSFPVGAGGFGAGFSGPSRWANHLP